MARPVILAGLLGAAVGVPYVVSQGPQGFPELANLSGMSGLSKPTAEWSPQSQQSFTLADFENLGPKSDIYRHPAPLAGLPTHSLAEVLRMDITKEWVYSRWTRKSTGLSDPELFGIRVPLVTGTRMADLAGSLSYFFDNYGLLQRIEFHGTTADTTEIVSLLTTTYGFQPDNLSPAGNQRFTVTGPKGVESYLQTSPSGVLWGNQPHNSFVVDLVLNRPGSGRVANPPIPALGDFVPDLAVAPTASPNSEKPVFPGESVVPTAKESAAAAPKEPPPQIESVVDEFGFRGRRPTSRWPN